MNAPTLTLIACPICSTLQNVERPFWRFAANASAARQKKCYILSGCAHVVGDRNPATICDDPEQWKIAEEIWQADAERLFEAVTAEWQDGRRKQFRQLISASKEAGENSLAAGTLDAKRKDAVSRNEQP